GEQYVNALALSPDGRIALSGSGYYVLDAKRQPVMKDGKYVYQDIALRLFDLKTGKKLREREDLEVPVGPISFRPDGQPFVSLWNAAPQFWEATRDALKEGRELKDLAVAGKGHPYVFSPDGKSYLAGLINQVAVESATALRSLFFD